MACLTPVMQQTREQCAWHLLVADPRSAMQGDPTRTATAGGSHIPFVKHPLDVGRSENIVINPVAVFLLEPGVEKREAGQTTTEPHSRVRPSANVTLPGVIDTASAEVITSTSRAASRRRNSESTSDAGVSDGTDDTIPELAAQIGLFLDDRRTDAAIRKPQCGLNTGDTAAYDDNLSFHCALIL